MEEKKTKATYIANITAGVIVAFKNDSDVYSGKVVEVPEDSESKFVIKTKNGSVYYVEPDNIIWVKTGSHWPNGIFNALKYSSK